MSEQDRETEDDEDGGTLDTAPMLPGRPPDHQTSALTYAQRPGQAGRGLTTLLLLGRALAWLLLHLLLPGTVFLLVLLPAAAVVYLGFLCHSRVHPAPGPGCRALLSDRGSAALIVFGFLLLPPLLVLASAVRSHLMRRLRPLLPPSAWTPEPHSNREEQFCACV
ncbi:PREDICTED: transmembrane protein 88B [Chinchilla lanigera]|uniref:Transmembrane protein 88B n=1 Tax=Chinchilla lanigera TaxID=34839 RepID=A0A8C2VBK9_CHILA|nr:PREDICTED: transmembrane protein 88B [Chinchilla lanigera]